MTASSYLTYTALVGSLAILAALLLGLNRALAQAGLPTLEQSSISRRMGIVLFVWYVAVLALSWLEFFHGAPGRIPTIALGVFVPIIVGMIALQRSRTLHRIIDAVPQS